MNDQLQKLQGELTEARATIAKLEAERENWRVSSVCRELREQIEYLKTEMKRLHDEHGGVISCQNFALRSAWDERDRYKRALEEIAKQEDFELVLDPTWAKRIATEAVSGVGVELS